MWAINAPSRWIAHCPSVVGVALDYGAGGVHEGMDGAEVAGDGQQVVDAGVPGVGAQHGAVIGQIGNAMYAVIE